MNEQWRKKTKKEIVNMLSNLDTYTIDDVEYKILSKNEAWLFAFKNYPYSMYIIDYKHHNAIVKTYKNKDRIKRKRSDAIFLVNLVEYEAWYEHDQVDRIINSNKRQAQVGEVEPTMPVVPEYHANKPLDSKDDIIEIYGLKYHKLDEYQEKFVHTNICASDIAKSRYNVYWYTIDDEGIYRIYTSKPDITSIDDEDLSTENTHIGGYIVLVDQYDKFWFSYTLYNECVRLDKECEEVREEVYEEYRAKREAVFEDLKSDESIKGKFSDQDLNAIARYIQILNDEDEEEETTEISSYDDSDEAEIENSRAYTDSIDNIKSYVDNKIKENLDLEMSEDKDIKESDSEDHNEQDASKYKVFAQILNIIPANMLERCLGVSNLHVNHNSDDNEDYFLILKSDSPMYYFINGKYSLDEEARFFKCNNTYITNPLGAYGSKESSGDTLLYRVRIPYRDKSMVYDIIDLLYKGHPMFISISTAKLFSILNIKLTHTIDIAGYFNSAYNETIKFAESYGDDEYEYGFPVLDEDNIDEVLGDAELGTIYPMITIPIRNNTKIFVKTSYGTFINGNGTEFTPGDLLGFNTNN